jgi:thiamine pyrophosphate-dependent acetolactate synthase large subunit-like protein
VNVAEQIAEICRLEGVRLVAGVMGGNATQLVRALDGIPGRHILYCRQERVAVDAADGYARVTGEPAVVFTDAGPGAANTMVGIVNSWGDSVPVLFLPPVVGPYDNVFGRRHSKELPVAELFAPVSKWAMRLSDQGQVDDVMSRAFRLLREPRSGPVVIGVPQALSKEESRGSHYTPVGRPRPLTADPADIEKAVQLLAGAQRPYVYVGAGVLTSRATAELRALAELLTLPVATTLNAKSAFPETHPLSLGLGGFAEATYSTLQANRTVAEADVVLTIGAGFKRDAIKAPMPGGIKLIQVDIDPNELNSKAQADVAILGDAKAVLQQLLEAARDSLPKERFEPRADVIGRVADLTRRWWEICEPMLTSNETPINPFRVTKELADLVDHDQTIVLHDAGGTRGYVCQHYQATVPGSFVGYGVQSSMGWTLGAAMGAKVAAPDKLVVAFVGDEAFCETAMDIETSVTCDAPILVVLLNNRADNIRHLDQMTGKAGFNPTLGPYRWGGGKNLTEVARALGAKATRVEDPAQLRSALAGGIRSVSEGHTTVVEVVTARTKHRFPELFGADAASA